MDTDAVTWGEFGPIVPDDQIAEQDIPTFGDWEAISRFALTFDGYAYWGPGDTCATLANRLAKRYYATGALPSTITELRTCLFFEQRRWHHTGSLPQNGPGQGYIAALLDAIRRCVAIPIFTAIPEEVRSALEEAASRWRAVGPRARPRVAPEVLAHWDGLIEAWVNDARMPLLVRKSAVSGQLITHTSGRSIVCADNSPANWCLSSALLGQMPTPEDLLRALTDGSLPIAMIKVKASSPYTGTMTRMRDVPNLNTRGWTVCHVHPAGLKEPLTPTTSLGKLMERSRRFLTPRNMFLVPLGAYAALGELPEFIAAFDAAAGGGDC